MRVPAVVAAVVVAAALVSGGCSRNDRDQTETEFPITISVTCFTDSVVAKVAPSTVQLTNKQLPVWKLTSTSTISEFSIDKKKDPNEKKWPYGGALPYKGDKNKAAKGDGKIDPEPAGTRNKYGYSVTAICTPPDGPIKSIVIDPDIIIIWN